MKTFLDRREAQNEARQISKWDRAIVMVFKAGPEFEVVKWADREEHHKQSYPLVTFDCGHEINY